MLASNHSFSIKDLSRSSMWGKVWGIIINMWRSSWLIQRLSYQKKKSLLAQLMGSFPGVLAPPPKWSHGSSKAIVNPASTRATFIPAPLKADTEHWWCQCPNLETFFWLAPRLGVMEILPPWLFRVWGCEVQHENPPGNRQPCVPQLLAMPESLLKIDFVPLNSLSKNLSVPAYWKNVKSKVKPHKQTEEKFFMHCCLMGQHNKLEIWIPRCHKPGRQWWIPDMKGSSSQSEVVEMHLSSAEFQCQQSAGSTQKCNSWTSSSPAFSDQV